MSAPKPTTVKCSCCGSFFTGHPDPDLDVGYGHCESCLQWIAERQERDWDKARDQVAAALNETNRAKFLAMDAELQRGMMLTMLDEGVISFAV